MKPVLVILFLTAGLLAAANAQTSPDAILGKWTNEDRTRVIEFVKAGVGYAAVIREAPDRSMVGKSQLTNLVYSNGTYTGNVLLPKKGKSYPCTLKIERDSTMQLTAKAGLMSKTQGWTRVK